MNSVEKVKAICKARKIAISKLEKDLGYANGYIGQLRKGVFPSDRLMQIAEYLNVSPQFLTGDEELSENKKSPTPEGVELSPIKQEAWQILNSLSDEKLEKVLVILRAAAEM